jgi:hypothetical protein
VKAAERLIYHISREKASGEKLSRSAPGAQASLADSRFAGAAPL